MNLSSIINTLKKIDSSNKFQLIVIIAIILSALSIGAHTYRLPTWLSHGLLTFDYCITLFFLFEIIVRFLACQNPKKFFSRGWNIFDTLVIIGSLIPIAGSTVLLARLLRIFRVLRLISVVPELRLLINALLKAIPRMAYIGLLMFIIFYIYATIGSILFVNVNDENWGGVGASLLTMFRIATFDNWGLIMGEAMASQPLSWIFFISFIFLATFIFLNMMVGTILDVMSKETQVELNEAPSASNTHASLEDVQRLMLEIQSLKAILISSNQKEKPEKE